MSSAIKRTKVETKVTWKTPFVQQVWDLCATAGRRTSNRGKIPREYTFGPIVGDGTSEGLAQLFVKRDKAELAWVLMLFPRPANTSPPDWILEGEQQIGGRNGLNDFLAKVAKLAEDPIVQVDSKSNIRLDPVEGDRIPLPVPASAITDLDGALGEDATVEFCSFRFVNGVSGLIDVALGTLRPGGIFLAIKGKTTLSQISLTDKILLQYVESLWSLVVAQFVKPRSQTDV